MRLLAAIILSSLLSGYVNPFIGTTNFGATNPGAVCPNGMMSVSPFNVMGSDLNTWDKDSRWWSTPYTYENRFFTGFSHVNLSGVGCPEVGIVLTMPTSGEKHMAETTGKIASACGRFYAMDRDKRWNRVKEAYDLLTEGKGDKFTSAIEGIQASYDADVTDEFVKPICVTDAEGKPLATIEEGDAIIRTDSDMTRFSFQT